MSVEGGCVDYLCNAFLPGRQRLWTQGLQDVGSAVKVTAAPGDSFADPEAMVTRMDDLGIATIVLPTADGRPGNEGVSFENVASHWDESEDLVRRWPGRFAALAAVDPSRGMAGVRETRRHLARPWVIGSYLHTHSWGRPLDHRDLYPYYALCAELDVPFVMQAGISGGPDPSACGRPIALDEAALYFPETRFVLSHLAWPWTDEALAMAIHRPNVYVGTASYPPRHWGPSVRSFITGRGRRKVVFGTNFPTVGHGTALRQLNEMDLEAEIQEYLLRENALGVFSRLAQLQEVGS